MKKKKRNFFYFLWVGLKYLLLAGVAALILVLVLLSSAYGDLKDAAIRGLKAKNGLSAAVTQMQAQDWPAAMRLAAGASQDFSLALDDLGRSRENNAVRYVPPVRSQIDDLEYLLKTGEILSRSLERLLPLAQNLDEVRSGAAGQNFSALPLAKKNDFLRLIYESEPELRGLRANLELAILNLDKIHRLGILWPVYGQISDIKSELAQTASLLAKSSPLIKLLPALTGYPSASRFLLVMQNNDELRPSGGFIGVYGLMEVRSGELLHLETDDSYHIDMPASISDKWQLEPPEVLKKYLEVEKWYLRDANWSPDWAQSAEQITHIYNGVIGVTDKPSRPFTGIIALTPDLVSDLIGLVGPITVRGETYTPDNFQPLLQYNVEIAYREQNISQWDRKDVVDELMAELKARLFSLPSDKWGDLFKIVDNNVAARDLQIYFANPVWQDLARELGASGEVADPAGDFLMAVDANLAAFKSDAVVKKDISYRVLEKDGGLEAAVTLSYRHQGGFDWRTTRYRSYTRVYAPLGSRFISLTGADDESNQSVGDDGELKKTVFGFFFTVEPGTERDIVLRYRLADTIYEDWRSGAYTLLVQKQAGRRTESLRVDFQPAAGKAATWITDFETDKNFWFNLKQ